MRIFQSLRLALIVAGALLVASNPAFAQYANNEPIVTYAAEVPLLDCNGVPCVVAQTADGKSWRMGIDTGNENSVIASKSAEAAGLKPTKPTPKGRPA
jgi:hypothetical protein